MKALRLRGLLEAAGAAALAGLVLATPLAWAGGLWWWADLASHFRPQYLVASTLLAAGAAFLRRRRLAALLAAVAVANAAAVLPALRGPAPPADGAPVLRLASVNVHTQGRAYRRVAEFIRTSRPDVLLLLEVDEGWMQALSPVLQEYRVRVTVPRPDNFGIALLSRLPCADCRARDFGAGVPSVVGTLEVGGRRVRLLGTHPLPPVSAGYAAEHAHQLRAIGRALAADTTPRLVLGDLNSTPWSARYRALIRTAGLRSAGRGLHRTWPAGFWPAGIQIDHVLVSPHFRRSRLRAGPDVGSDHLPLVAEVQL